MKKIKEFLNKNKDIIFIVIMIIILAIIKQWIIQDFPIIGFVSAGEDDVLMINLAKNILSGNWLGEYKYNTLMKGPVFPMLLAMLYKFKIPFIASMTALYTFSCVVFMIAIRKMIKNKYVFVGIFAILLFNPIMYCFEIIQRVYRNALIPSFALLITGSYIAIFLRRNEKSRYSIIWSLIAAISLSAFYYTREDSMWILPFVIFMTISIIIAKLIKEKKINLDFLTKTIFVIIPIVSLVAFGNWISTKNEKYYGVKTTNILKKSSFVDAIDAIYAVRPNRVVESVTVTQEKVDRMAAVSPTFAGIAPKLHEKIGGYGALDRNPGDAEVDDGWILWAIRIAAVESGYNTIELEEQFYKKVAEDLNWAMDEGLLERQRTMPSALLSPYKRGYTFKLMKIMAKGAIYISTFDGINISNDILSNDKPSYLVKDFEEMSGNRAIYPEDATDIDGTKIESLETQDEYIKSLDLQNNILNVLIKVYGVIGVIIGIIAVIYYMILTVITIKNIFIKKYETLEKWIIISGILGALFTLLAGVSYNHLTACNSIGPLYLAGSYPLFLAFCMICVYNAIIKVLNRKLEN